MFGSKDLEAAVVSGAIGMQATCSFIPPPLFLKPPLPPEIPKSLKQAE